MLKKIVGLTHNTESLDMDGVLKKKRFEFIPGIAYNILNLQDNNIIEEKTDHMELPKPFVLFAQGTPIELIRKFITTEDLSSAKMAYSKLMDLAYKNIDRIIADLYCSLIISIVDESRDSDEVIFFFDGSAWDKILGRLASLYLPDRITFCFLTYKTEQLLTSIIAKATGKLDFDLLRIMNDENSVPIGPYPGSFEDSLTQTYFYRPNRGGKEKLEPLRLEIFAQGLLESEFVNKKDTILDLLRNPEMTMLYKIGDNKVTTLPKSLFRAIEYKNISYKNTLKLMLGEVK